MAKKTAADLDMTPFAVAQRHHDACQAKCERIWSEIDKMFDASGDDLKPKYKLEDLDKKLAESARAHNELMRAAVTLDRYQRGLIEVPSVPTVSEEEVRAVINASLDDKMDELQFKVNRGILASAVARGIATLVHEEDVAAAYCKDHS